MPPYRYQPLEHDDSIRILVLHLSGSESDPIKCTLRHIQLSHEAIPYDALSYTWGDLDQIQVIYLDDGEGELSVRKNCYNALSHLRRRDEDRFLWIDAICINQDDLQERAHQVSLMNEIYNGASNVVVSLEEQQSVGRVLFDELAAVDDDYLRNGICYRAPPSDAVIKELEELYQNPWCERVWILQEVCDKTSVIFICGAGSFSYRSLSYVYWIMYPKIGIWPTSLEWIGIMPKVYSTPQFNLWYRLYESREYQATDPKDKVFALKSLIGPDQSDMTPLIDYAQSVEECFTKVAMFLLPVLGLRILTATRHPHERDMSSWIPDWSRNLPLQSAFFYTESLWDTLFEFSKDGGPALRPSEENTYKILPESTAKNKSFPKLSVTGCRYAEIEHISPVFKFTSREDAMNQFEDLLFCVKHLAGVADADRLTDIQKYTDIIDKTERSILEALSNIDTNDIDIHFRRGHILSDRWGDSQTFGRPSLLHRSFAQCRLSLMDNGEVAIVPDGIRSGDVVCVLSGSVAPCVLRLVQDGLWTLISGDCYILQDRFSNDWGIFCSAPYILENAQRVEEFIIR